MHLHRRVWAQLSIFIAVTLIFGTYMVVGYLNLPYLLFNAGHYTVTMQLSQAAGLYERSNVTYRGIEVGRVTSVDLSDGGVEARLSLDSAVPVPSDLTAAVHSQSAIGEQYVELLPRDVGSRPLRDGDLIPVDRTTTPPSITNILDRTNVALEAIPKDSLKTVVDESATAVGGLGPELSRIVNGSTQLARGAQTHLDDLTTLIDGAQPVLDSQADSAHSIAAWAANVATLTRQLRDRDAAVASLLTDGAAAAAQARALVERIRPTLPLLLANLVSIGQIALVYRADIEQILVLLPQVQANNQATVVPNKNLPPGPYKGSYLSFNLNLNLPPPCTTGYLPASTRRSPSELDFPDRPKDDLYCRIPQDSPLDVRGIRNIPCEAKPWKRAPTVAMCESDEEYVPLNDGFNWKGDPNATLSGQDIPQPRPPDTITLPPPPQTVPQAGLSVPPPLAAAAYDPVTGTYVGPDGKTYTQADLAGGSPPHTWQSMLTPAP